VDARECSWWALPEYWGASLGLVQTLLIVFAVNARNVIFEANDVLTSTAKLTRESSLQYYYALNSLYVLMCL